MPPRSRPQKTPKPAAKKLAASKDDRQQTEVSTQTSAFAIKDRVTHRLFGNGVVTAVDGEKLTIKFEDGRVKQIVDYYVTRRKV